MFQSSFFLGEHIVSWVKVSKFTILRTQVSWARTVWVNVSRCVTSVGSKSLGYKSPNGHFVPGQFIQVLHFQDPIL